MIPEYMVDPFKRIPGIRFEGQNVVIDEELIANDFCEKICDFDDIRVCRYIICTMNMLRFDLQRLILDDDFYALVISLLKMDIYRRLGVDDASRSDVFNALCPII